MPKSKRNKLVTLSATRKKGREHKESVIQGVRAALEQYSALYVFEYDTMRNSKFKEIRDELKESSRFFLGANRVLQVALGRDEATELREGLHSCSQLLVGQRGVLLTNLPHEEVARQVESSSHPDFARAGSLATETVELPQGPLEQFSHDMEPFIRKQGLPVRLNKGTIELLGDYTVCQEGEPLSSEAATILRLLGIQMAEFKLHLVARWADGVVEEFEPAEWHKSGTDVDDEGGDGFIEDDDEQAGG